MDEFGGDAGSSLRKDGLPGPVVLLDRLMNRLGNHLPGVHEMQMHRLFDVRLLLLLVVCIILIMILPKVVVAMLMRVGHLALNYRGERIPQSCGLLVVAFVALMLLMIGYLYPGQREQVLSWLILALGYGALGMIDDLWGGQAVKGLRGHVRALWKDRTVTTGLVKAVGGVSIALGLASRLAPGQPVRLLVAAMLIALSANAINLLDLRPGRACAAFLLVALPLVAGILCGGKQSLPPLLLVVIATFCLWKLDGQAKGMMGDVGSNVLGASLGWTLGSALALEGQLVILLGLIGLHLLAERRSLTAIIAGSRVLSALDRMSGVRGEK